MTSFFNILITYHTSDEPFAKLVLNTLTQNGFDHLFLADETQPTQVEIRYEYMNKTNVFIVISSRNYLREEFCMELINYARDLKKEIFAFNTKLSFRPFGALGAIIAATGRDLIELENELTYQKDFQNLINTLNELKKSTNGEQIIPNRILPAVNLNFLTSKLDVLVSYHTKQKLNAELIGEGLRNGSYNYELEDSTTANTNVKNCQTLVIVISDDYEENYTCKAVVDVARSMKKPIIPVVIKRGWKSKKWVGLVISGKLFFRFIDREQVYKITYDLSPINEFLFEVAKVLRPRPIQSEREKSLIKSLEERIEKCKVELKDWPPPHKTRPKKELKPVKVTLKEPKSDIEYTTTHYTVTRFRFFLPKPIYDNFGVPIREKFDAMISYQWSRQKLVREIFTDLHMANLSIWFDIWGFMEGCTYDAMATAIECSKVMVVFLSKNYQESVNCQLEFKYAVARGKAFIFVLLEDNLNLESWIKPYFDENVKFEIKRIEDLAIVENGVPRIFALAQAIRDIGAVQIDDDCYELSDKAILLKETLEDALDEIDRLKGSSRFRECSRCKKQFDDNNLMDCRKHSAYYLGGQIIAGRWVCCGQLEKDSVGCINATHIDVLREWKVDPDYGTYTWEPS